MTARDRSSASCGRGWTRPARATPRRALSARRRRRRTGAPALATSDEGSAPDRPRLGGVVRPARRVGRGGRAHRETARWLAEQQGAIRWPGTCRRWSAATSAPAGCAPSASTPTASRSRDEDRGGAGRAALRRVRRRGRARAGCPTGSCASARRRSRSRLGSTGASRRAGCHVRGKGDEKSTAASSHAARRRRGGGADEDLLARARRHAEGGARAMSPITHIGTVVVPSTTRTAWSSTSAGSASRSGSTRSSPRVSAGSRWRRRARRPRSRSCRARTRQPASR